MQLRKNIKLSNSLGVKEGQETWPQITSAICNTILDTRKNEDDQQEGYVGESLAPLATSPIGITA